MLRPVDLDGQSWSQRERVADRTGVKNHRISEFKGQVDGGVGKT